MSFLKKHLSKPDPLSKIFRYDSTPYKIDLYFVKPVIFKDIKINIKRMREE